MNFLFLFTFLLILTSSKLQGEVSPEFCYISYSTNNIGDDIQAIAAKNLLHGKLIPINRELVSQFTHNSKIKTLMNGWYMHTGKSGWHQPDGKVPNKSWPPANCIDPLLTSIHFTESFLPIAFSSEGTEYLKKHAPIGARDYFTLRELQQRNIPCYFSGCLTLTLENSYNKRDNIIYAVDIGKECVNFIKKRTQCKVEFLTHSINPWLNQAQDYLMPKNF